MTYISILTAVSLVGLVAGLIIHERRHERHVRDSLQAQRDAALADCGSDAPRGRYSYMAQEYDSRALEYPLPADAADRIRRAGL